MSGPLADDGVWRFDDLRRAQRRAEAARPLLVRLQMVEDLERSAALLGVKPAGRRDRLGGWRHL